MQKTCMCLLRHSHAASIGSCAAFNRRLFVVYHRPAMFWVQGDVKQSVVVDLVFLVSYLFLLGYYLG